LIDKERPKEPEDIDTILELITEASSLVDKIKLDLAKYDPDALEIQDNNIRIALKRINGGEKFRSVIAYETILRFLKEKSNENTSDYEPPDFISDYWNELFRIFHSRFDINSYFYSKLEIGPLITSVSVSPTLKEYFAELREAYAHGLYKSCVAICRTLLEVSLKDGLSKIEKYRNTTDILKMGKNKADFEFSLFENISIAYSLGLVSKDLKEKANTIRTQGNKIVHSKDGNSKEKQTNVYEIVKNTIEIIESLYRS
jgi:hypothetical protein